MTTAANLIERMQQDAARHFAGSELTVTQVGSSAFTDDLSVTIGAQTEFTVACSSPRMYEATTGGDSDLMGSTFVLVNRSDAAILFEPQPGMSAEVSGEQYRIKTVRYLPGAIRIFLSGGAAEGTASS